MCKLFPNFFQNIKHFLLLLTLTLLVSCANTQKMTSERPLPSKKIGVNINEVKLGDSKFYLRIPDGFDVVEARGKEGQRGFNILPKNNSSKMFGSIETQHGHPIIDSNETLGTVTEYIQSTFLDVPIKWVIYFSKSKYYYAETPVIRGISASAFSDKRDDIDSIISIIHSLVER